MLIQCSFKNIYYFIIQPSPVSKLWGFNDKEVKVLTLRKFGIQYGDEWNECVEIVNKNIINKNVNFLEVSNMKEIRVRDYRNCGESGYFV